MYNDTKMGNVTLWYLDGIQGRNVFRNIMTEYNSKEGLYPRNEEIPEWLTTIGWPCTLAVETVHIGSHDYRVTHGVKFEDTEALTAFILRWG